MCVYLHISMYAHTPFEFLRTKVQEVEITLNK